MYVEITQLKKDKTSLVEFVQGLLVHKHKEKKVPVLPRKMIQKVIRRYHDELTGGHFGVDKTTSKIKEITWWPTLKEDVREYVKHYDKCQRYKVRNGNTTAPMKPILQGIQETSGLRT